MIEKLVRNEAPSLVDTAKGNELIDAINSLMSSEGGTGIDVTADQSGKLIISLDESSSSFGSYHPFQVIKVDTSNNTVTINPGTINGVVPTPYTSVTGVSGDGFIIVEANINSEGTITSAQYDFSSSPANGSQVEKNSIPSSVEVNVAYIKGAEAFALRTTGITVTPRNVLEQPKDTVSIGEYPNDIYYGYIVT